MAFRADESRKRRMAAKPVDTAAAVGSDAADGKYKRGTDFSVGHRGVSDEHRDQALAPRRQRAERLAQRHVTFRGEQFLFGRRCVLVWERVEVWRVGASCLLLVRGAPHAD